VTDTQPAYLPETNMYTTFYQSAVVVGTAFEVTDPAQKTTVLHALCEKLTPNEMEGFDRAIAHSLSVTGVWGIHMKEVGGKRKSAKTDEITANRRKT